VRMCENKVGMDPITPITLRAPGAYDFLDSES
jgi:hypothetical protein